MLPTSVTKRANNGHEQQEGHPARDWFPPRRCVWGDRMSGANRTLGRTPCPPRRPPETTARLLPTSSCPRLPTRQPASSPPRADGSNPALRGSARAAGSRSLPESDGPTCTRLSWSARHRHAGCVGAVVMKIGRCRVAEDAGMRRTFEHPLRTRRHAPVPSPSSTMTSQWEWKPRDPAQGI